MALATRADRFLHVLEGGRTTWEREEGVMELTALCDEVMASCERIQVAAACESYSAVVNEAGRLGHKAESAKADFLALVPFVPGDAA